jgi:Tol biopolymer transport system component
VTRRLGGLPVALAAATALALGACGGSDAPADPELVVVSSRDGDYALYGLSADGGGERRLTPREDIDASSPRGLFFQVEPAWSPDGGRIAFASKRGGSFDLYVMDADGSATTRLTSTREDEAGPTWSPDGARIAFARGASPRLWVMEADGSRPRRLVEEDTEASEPAWSPDGRWIAYVRREPGTSVREVWVVRPDGTGRRQVTSLDVVAQSPTWSPESDRIAFAANIGGTQFDVYSIGADGEGIEAVTTTRADTFEPSWSPGGDEVAYSEDGAVHVVELGSGTTERLTNAANNDSSPAWRPARADG